MARVTEAHIEARRDQIVDAAWACFARKGYHQTTMQEIADEAGISAGAIYRYYAGKEAVLKAISERSREMSSALVAAARTMTADPLDTIEVLGRTMLSLFSEPEFKTVARVNIEIWPEILRNDELSDGLREELTFWLSAITGLFAEAQRKGELHADVDPRALATVLICAWEGMRHFHLLSDVFRPEALVEVVRALQPPEARPQGPASAYVSDVPPLTPPLTALSRPKKGRGK
jgi:AcrR family transcriptional regulator